MTLGSANFISQSGLVGIDNIPGTSQVAIAVNSSPNTLISAFDCTTRTQVGSTITLNNVSTVVGLSMMNSTRGMLVTGSGVHYLFDLSALTTNTLLTSSNGVLDTTGRYFQEWACQGTNGFYLGNSAIGKIDFTALTNVATSPYWIGGAGQGDAAIAVIAKPGSSNLIISTFRGRILEVDTNLNVVSQYMIKQPALWLGLGGRASSITGITQFGRFLAYYAGYLLVSTNIGGQFILFDHESGAELHRVSWPLWNSSGIADAPPLCQTNKHWTFSYGSEDFSMGPPIIEIDFLQTPIQQRGYFYGEGASNNNGWRVMGYNQSANLGWGYHTTLARIYFWSVSGVRTLSTLPVSQTQSSVGIKGEAIILSDAGVGSMATHFHTTIPASGRNVPVTAGLNALVFMKGGGTGVNEKGVVDRTNPT